MFNKKKEEKILFCLIEAHFIQHQEVKQTISELSKFKARLIKFIMSKRLENAFYII